MFIEIDPVKLFIINLSSGLLAVSKREERDSFTHFKLLKEIVFQRTKVKTENSQNTTDLDKTHKKKGSGPCLRLVPLRPRVLSEKKRTSFC